MNEVDKLLVCSCCLGLVSCVGFHQSLLKDPVGSPENSMKYFSFHAAHRLVTKATYTHTNKPNTPLSCSGRADWVSVGYFYIAPIELTHMVRLISNISNCFTHLNCWMQFSYKNWKRKISLRLSWKMFFFLNIFSWQKQQTPNYLPQTVKYDIRWIVLQIKLKQMKWCLIKHITIRKALIT